MTVYESLALIAESNTPKGYLAHYKNDLHVIDKDTLAKTEAGQQYIWILRECGTQLFPVAAGHDSLWATYWLDNGNRRDTPSLCYLITVTSTSARDGTVAPISYDRTRRLAALPHPNGVRVKFSLS
jgi:hypothetical protein